MSGLSTRLYKSSPVPIQHALVSIKGGLFRWKRANESLMRAEFEKLLVSQWWSADEHRSYQNFQLYSLIRCAMEQVPYYRNMRREHGIHPEDISSVEQLKHIPILEKQTLRSRSDEFLAGGVIPRGCYRSNTSGTTGTPLTTFESRDAFSRRWSFVLRLRRWAGLDNVVQPRRAQFTGRDIIPDPEISVKGSYWRHNYPGNTLLFSTTHLGEQSISGYVKALTDFKPELVDGYPSALVAVARLARARGLALPRVKAAIVSAETLTDAARHDIEEGFQTQVFNQYASSEPSCFWSECERGTLHQNPEYGISEIVDANGVAVQPGETGMVVVTSFCNPLMPLLRYKLGDLAVAGTPARCECGRAMPTVARIVGRSDDVLYIPRRGYVGRLDPVFKGVTDIIESQIIQESLDRISVLIVPSAGFTTRTERILRSNIVQKVGNEIAVDIRKVGQIPRGPNGKFRAVVCRVPPGDLPKGVREERQPSEESEVSV